MKSVRWSAVAVLILVAAVRVDAQCVSGATLLWSDAHLKSGPVAWTGDTLAVASSAGVSRAIRLTIHDGQGTQVAAPRTLVEASNRGPLALLWTGSELGLFYVSNLTLKFQRMTAAGVPIGEAVQLDDRIVSLGDELDFAWNAAGGTYLVARTITSGILRARVMEVAPDGSIQRTISIPPLIGPRSRLRVAVTEGGIGGVFFYAASGELIYARIGPEEFLVVVTLPISRSDLVVASIGERFIVARTVDIQDGRSGVGWFRINTEGTIVQPDALLLTGIGVEARPAAFVVRDEETALAFFDSLLGGVFPPTYRLRRMTPAGGLITDVPFSVTDPILETGVSSHPFVWTGRAYMQVVGNVHAFRDNTYLVQYCPLQVNVSVPPYVLRGQSVQLTAIPDGGVPGYSYSWAVGDRPMGKGTTLQHVFNATGAFEVTVTITDALGISIQKSVTINVIDPKMRAVRR